MTLLLTEIHNHDSPTRAVIVFAADRRISIGTKFHSLRMKIHPIPRLCAAVGYFGLAEVKSAPMIDWLRAHVLNDRSSSVGEFAASLAAELNLDVPAARRRSTSSGFHVAGFNAQGLAEFWFVRNIDDSYQLTGTYAACEDFQGRDVGALPAGAAQIYRNGDIDAHVALWTKLDEALLPMLNRHDFKRVKTSTDYAHWVRFKMEVIAYTYKRWCKVSLIGRPIDTVIVTAKDGARVV